MRRNFILQFLIFISLVANAQEKGMDELWGEQTINKNITKNTDWYTEAKFAMFIHWGLYSKMAGEWDGQHYFGINEWIMKRAKINTKDYKETAKTFNPSQFDADAIAQLAVDAGMKYLVITAKHHDGFAMFDSKVSDFTITKATPYKKDVVKALQKACKKKGLKFGIYYSQTQDWFEKNGYGNNWEFNPDEADFQKYLTEKALPQIKELLTGYGEIGCIFFDTPGPIREEQVVQLKEMVEKYQPNCLINSRIGQGLGDFTTLGDNEIPSMPLDGLWETCDTHNNTWAYSNLDFNWKTQDEIIHRLIDVVSKGGNYLFNIGPKADGSVPDVSAMILRETGHWISKYKEAIYGTQPLYLGGQTQFAATQKGNKMYLFVKEWPENYTLNLPKFENKTLKAYFMDSQKEVNVSTNELSTVLTLPLMKHDAIASVIVVEFEGTPKVSTDKVINSGLETLLLPHEAELVAVEKGKNRWMEIFGDWHSKPVLTQWASKGSKASWEVVVPSSGMYIVSIDYACDQDSDMQEGLLTINDKKYNFVPTYSGEVSKVKNQREVRRMDVFKKRKLGVINFEKEGKQKITIELNDIDKTGWINLASVSFEPVPTSEDKNVN
ncbi:alpha-L-fucosidase [Flammeovirga agarivorans]|uniref:alpha-L-fucosidase n=1 Tax=Flammeovirga agarivorans TaxID=2726742 RepID=A0A7X8SNZ8_9BACT|nr:alpha-L-fucosidase [Flammeovirga agarivorans]NLR93622.1 alpha-L-fucosidase [Flammeovirga agarivorans]